MEKVCHKTHSWNDKMLSGAGRITLIKAVLMAVPIYTMSCYKLPDSFCKRLHGLIGRYWWAHNSNKKPIFWTSYSNLCKDKERGGLGFRDLCLINDALLIKQGWRILTQPNSLLSSVLKAKYFRDSSLLEARLGNSPSSVWRAIFQAIQVAKQWFEVQQVGAPRWKPDPNGCFSTKSAYHALVGLRDRTTGRGEPSDLHHSRRFWQAIWKSKMEDKVKIFAWKLYNGYLPVMDNLRHRGCIVLEGCPVCGYPSESLVHTFLNCWWAKAYWLRSGLLELVESRRFVCIQDWMWHCVEKASKDEFVHIIYGARQIWYNRNRVAHGDSDLDVLSSIISTKSWVKYIQRPEFTFSIDWREGSWRWLAPRGNTIKINCDGCLDEANTMGGIGCVARDGSGTVLRCLARPTINISSSLHVEGLALGAAIDLAKKEQWQRVCFETDNAELFQILMQNGGTAVNSVSWLGFILTELAAHHDWGLSLARWEANSVADSLAKKAGLEAWTFEGTMAIPRCIGPFVGISG